MKPFMTFNEGVSKRVDWEVALNETIQRTEKSNRPNQVSWWLRFSTNQCSLYSETKKNLKLVVDNIK